MQRAQESEHRQRLQEEQERQVDKSKWVVAKPSHIQRPASRCVIKDSLINIVFNEGIYNVIFFIFNIVELDFLFLTRKSVIINLF
jgi:hypothetical protein